MKRRWAACSCADMPPSPRSQPGATRRGEPSWGAIASAAASVPHLLRHHAATTPPRRQRRPRRGLLPDDIDSTARAARLGDAGVYRSAVHSFVRPGEMTDREIYYIPGISPNGRNWQELHV